MGSTTSRSGPSAAAPDRIGGRVILLLLAGLVGLAAAGTGGLFLLKPGTALAGRPAAEARTAIRYARLPVMNFTLTDGDRLRELRLRVVLEMDPSVEPETVEPYGPRIANAMSNHMQDVAPQELRGGGGSILIKEAVMWTAGRELRPMKIRQVLVQEMLLR